MSVTKGPHSPPDRRDSLEGTTGFDLAGLAKGSPRATISQGEDGSVSFTSPATHGSWGAISPPLNAWQGPEGSLDSMAALELVLEVQRGRTSVSLHSDGETIGEERFVSAGPGRVDVVLPLDPELHGDARLLLCSAGDGRRTNRARVVAVRPRADTDAVGARLDLGLLVAATAGARLTNTPEHVAIDTGNGTGTWAAIAPPLAEWCEATGHELHAPVLLRVDIVVSGGAAGVSLVASDSAAGTAGHVYNAFSAVSLMLEVGPRQTLQRLLLSNAASDGSNSTVLLRGVTVVSLPETRPLDQHGVALDAGRLKPGGPYAAVAPHGDGLVEVTASAEPGAWAAVSPRIEEWCEQGRLATGMTPVYPALLELDVECHGADMGLSLVTQGDVLTLRRELVVTRETERMKVQLPVTQQDASAELLLRSLAPQPEGARFVLYGARLLRDMSATKHDPDGRTLDIWRMHRASDDGALALQSDGSVVITTAPELGAWGAVSPHLADWHEGDAPIDLPRLLAVDIEASEGEVGVSLVDDDMQPLVPERALRPSHGRTRIALYAGDARARLLVRQAGGTEHSGAVRIFGVDAVPPGMSRPGLLVEGLDSPLPASTRLLCVTHSDRVLDPERSSLNFLEKRYHRPDGMRTLAPFESLPARDPHRMYQGAVSLWSFEGDDWSQPQHVATLRPAFKPQQAIWYHERLWILGTERIDVLDASLRPVKTIEDNWLADAHTIMPLGDGRLVISCSSSDALLFLDEESLTVTRAERMSPALYGKNYDLKRRDSVVQHFIQHDSQTTHLNSAYPWEVPARGLAALRGKTERRVLYSTFIQGAVGWMDERGRMREVTRGFVSLHGARVDERDNDLYFSDTAAGLLVFLGADGRIKGRYTARSTWLHDAIQLHGDVFALAVSDRNVVEICNVVTKQVLTTIDGHPMGEGPQFLYYGL